MTKYSPNASSVNCTKCVLTVSYFRAKFQMKKILSFDFFFLFSSFFKSFYVFACGSTIGSLKYSYVSVLPKTMNDWEYYINYLHIIAEWFALHWNFENVKHSVSLFKVFQIVSNTFGSSWIDLISNRKLLQFIFY